MSETDTADVGSQEFEGHSAAFPDLDGMPEPDILQFVESALDRLSIESLGRLGDTIREKRQAKQEATRQSAHLTIEEQLQRSGLSLRDLFPELLLTPGRKRGESGPVPSKYRGPNGETWSGRGRMPNWLTALEVTGRTKDEFLIREEEA